MVLVGGWRRSLGCPSGQTQRGLERADSALQPSCGVMGFGGEWGCAPGSGSVVVGEFQVADAEAMLLFRRHGLEADPVGSRQQQTFASAGAEQQPRFARG